MKVNYILERAVINEFITDVVTWRWKQIAISETLESLKEIMGNRDRILDAHTLKEVYRTAPMYHSEILALVSGYSR